MGKRGLNNYQEYYDNSLEKGLEYQDFIADKLMELLAIPLVGYSSKKYQYKAGENKQGIEIKFDDKYKETGNIYIETSEKANPNNPKYVKSGIYRDDNSWLYLIGNYEKAFIFSINILRKQHRSKIYHPITKPTSKGFLLDEKGQSYAVRVLNFNKLKEE